MTLLRDHAWKLKYTPDDGNLARQFYVPALNSATRYDRKTGYFTAPALALAARGIENIVLNGGRMRLLVGCTLGEAEVQAIERGESLRETVERRLLAMPEWSADPAQIDALELLAWMIANDHLAVRLSIPCDLDRRPIAQDVIFHEKSGVIEDKTGDRIAFAGSINETLQGWMRNWESFSVFTSWRDLERVEIEEENFAKVWANRAQTLLTIDVPSAVKDRLLQFLPDPERLPSRLEGNDGVLAGAGQRSPAAPIEPSTNSPAVDAAVTESDRQAVWERIAKAATLPNGGERVGEATSAIVPWPHQIRAFDRMYRHWPPKLLIADEVGLGKTIETGLLLRQAWLAGRAKRILVLAPKSVCKQWQIELREKFNLNWPIYDGQTLAWCPSPARRHNVEREVGRDEWHKEPFVIMSSHLARRRDRQSELLSAEKWDLVIVDEAHHARRRAAGTGQDNRPNALLRLLRGLKDNTEGLVLLTATPMQVHPVELWDLLSLLGMPAAWTETAFVRFFEEVRQDAMPNERLEWLAALFRAYEIYYGQTSSEDAARFTGLGKIKLRRVLEALRDQASTPRRQLSPEERRGAAKLMARSSPVRALVSRHTRELLRRYHKAGLIDTSVATRRVADSFIDLSPDEQTLYRRVEDYISETYNKASPDEKNSVGFVMTIYRRRLASSFHALRTTLEARRTGVSGSLANIDDVRVDEDVADYVEAGDEDATEKLTEAERRVLAAEEVDTIDAIVGAIARLPTDTKARQLVDEIRDLEAAGYRQVIVFTQYTDTMDYLRDHLFDATGKVVMCFSGRGGEIRAHDGGWKQISREEVKARFKKGAADVLVCTDAAAEGLNFQFCGALINYDMPWNPMRVEQRIGRIDRLGQSFADIRITNLHYRDTVEADVYQALQQRISVFTNVVGGLQPILSRIPELIADAVLSRAGDESEKSAEAVRALEGAIEEGRATAIDLDEFADFDLTMPKRPDPALTLADLREILSKPRLMPPGREAKPLDGSDFRYEDGDLPEPIRVTVDPAFFEEHSDSVEFWTPGSPAFPPLGRFN
ncbi:MULTISPECIES: DEAD/DEAH box helicase [Methylosinus]|uniref:Helicase n=1 Tax=Methylosinus trichosporium (strain ATCC 35070 / NCIMB 11131 / UNIQEM 75 / OB3b) TaxID=595536 RepID=A0A2D2D1J7_METT3|nr:MULTISPECIES: helicase-related protein [Methylosinus]ATQ68860.1 helicase [Methylosinus trichosporium OB3b]OBS52046.1 helicase [Methylosinus sp. 3S-1]